MKIQSLENMEQVKIAQVGDILPIRNLCGMIITKGKMEGMIESKNENEITFIGKAIGANVRIKIKDLTKEEGISLNFYKDDDGIIRYLFYASYNNCFDTPNAIWDWVDFDDPIDQKYREAIK
jgi:hypothetical protein